MSQTKLFYNMKRNIIRNIFAPVLLVAVLVFAGCTKDDGPIKKQYLDLIDAIPVISTAIDASGDAAIDVLNPSAFQGKFTVSEFFDGPGSVSPEKVDVVVRKNGATGANVKLFAANVTSFPVSYSITATELEALFGAPIVLGDTYDFSVDIYIKGGRKYEAFPIGGIASSSGPTAIPGFSLFARYGAICAYDPDIYEGDFEVISTELLPGNWPITGEVVTFTRVSATSFSFEHPASVLNSPTGGASVVVQVNTGNNTVSVARSPSLGASWKWNSGFDGPYVIGTGAVTASYVAPCDQTVTLTLAYNVNAGSFGTRVVVLKKV